MERDGVALQWARVGVLMLTSTVVGERGGPATGLKSHYKKRGHYRIHSIIIGGVHYNANECYMQYVVRTVHPLIHNFCVFLGLEQCLGHLLKFTWLAQLVELLVRMVPQVYQRYWKQVSILNLFVYKKPYDKHVNSFLRCWIPIFILTPWLAKYCQFFPHLNQFLFILNLVVICPIFAHKLI